MRGGQRGRVVGARDRVAKLGGRARPVVQQIALRDHADGRPGCIGDAKVPHPETVHAPERPIEHLVAPHRPKGIAERVVALPDADAEPVRERFEPEVDEPSIECAGEMCDVESGGVAPGQAGARRLVAEHGEVEPDVLADDDPARERFPE